MMTGDKRSASARGSSAATAVAQPEAPGPPAHNLSSRDESPRRVAFRLSGTLLGPGQSFAWLLGLLGVAACVAPWFVYGWRWLELISVTVALLACYDAFALWLARKEFAPVLLGPEKGLRGREGQTIQLPLALAGSAPRRLRSEVRVALMPATTEGETAARVSSETQRLTLEWRNVARESAQARHGAALLWSWTPEVTLLRRGLWPGPRVGIERSSP